MDAEPADAVPLRHNAYKVEPAGDLAREILESLVRRPARGADPGSDAPA
ncbi:hypothetical protein [Streptomyces violascens]